MKEKTSGGCNWPEQDGMIGLQHPGTTPLSRGRLLLTHARHHCCAARCCCHSRGCRCCCCFRRWKIWLVTRVAEERENIRPSHERGTVKWEKRSKPETAEMCRWYTRHWGTVRHEWEHIKQQRKKEGSSSSSADLSEQEGLLLLDSNNTEDLQDPSSSLEMKSLR